VEGAKLGKNQGVDVGSCRFLFLLDAQDKIWRLCMDGKSTPQVLVESQLESIEGMALDWLSNNLYFVDGARSKIEVIRTDVNHSGGTTFTLSTVAFFVLDPSLLQLTLEHGQD